MKSTRNVLVIILAATFGLSACDQVEESTGNVMEKAKQAASELVTQTAEEAKNATGIDLLKMIGQPEEKANDTEEPQITEQGQQTEENR